MPVNDAHDDRDADQGPPRHSRAGDKGTRLCGRRTGGLVSKLAGLAGARHGEGLRRGWPTAARTIAVHYSPPSGHDATASDHPTPRRGKSAQELTFPARTPLVRALALHGVARPSGRLRSHLASPLMPGRGVLIRRVSRPVGSVACVRGDASPNEVSHEQPFIGCVLAERLSNPARPGVCGYRCAVRMA